MTIQFVEVKWANHTKQDGLIDMMLSVIIDGKPEDLPFGWDRNDPVGLSPTVTAWMDAHPDFPIGAYTAPVATLPDLLPYQFFAMLQISGHQTDVDNFIASLSGTEKIVAQAKLDHSLSFQRDNDLVKTVQQAVGISDADLDTLWAQAAQL